MPSILYKFLYYIQKCCSCCITSEQTRNRQLYNIYAQQLPNQRQVEIVTI